MPKRTMKEALVGDSPTRAAMILAVGLLGGGSSGTLLAQTDTHVRDIARGVVEDEQRVVDLKLKHLAEAVAQTDAKVEKVDGKLDEVLARLPRVAP